MVRFVKDNETIVSMFSFAIDSNPFWGCFTVYMDDGVFSVKRELYIPLEDIIGFAGRLRKYISREVDSLQFGDYDRLFKIEINNTESGDEVTLIFHSEVASSVETEATCRYISDLYRLEEACQDLVSELSLIGINV